MTVSKSFSAVGVSDVLAVHVGQQFTYSVSGTFVGTVVLEKQDKGRGEWKPIAPDVTATGSASGTLTAEEGGKSEARYRWRCSAYTSGTIVTSLAEVTSDATTVLRDVTGAALLNASEDGLEVPSGKTLTATSPAFSTTQGAVHAIERTFTETGAGTYTGAVDVPAGATVLDIIINGVALWDAGTSATLKVGDGGDDDGYYTGVNLKSTDLLAGESLSFALAGGKAGAYIANSQVSPRYSGTARVISGIVTSVGTGSAGRTRMTVVYHLPVSADIVAATKA